MFELIPYGKNDNFFANAFQDLESFSKNFFRGSAASMLKTDIQDRGNMYLIEMDVPGVQKQDIEIDIKDNYLTVKCKRHEISENKENNPNYIRRERSCGVYSRSFDIKMIQDEQITAKCENGVLRLELPKKQENISKTDRKINVQ